MQDYRVRKREKRGSKSGKRRKQEVGVGRERERERKWLSINHLKNVYNAKPCIDHSLFKSSFFSFQYLRSPMVV